MIHCLHTTDTLNTVVLFHSSPGAIPASMIPTPIPQTSITTPTPVILVTIPTPIPTLFYERFQLRFLLDSSSIATPEINYINSDFNTSPDDK